MSKRVSNKKTRPRVKPARSKVRYGWRKRAQREARREAAERALFEQGMMV